MRFSGRLPRGDAGDGPVDSLLVPGQVVLVEEPLSTHLAGKLALPVALHVLVQVQLGLEHLPTLPARKVPTPGVPDGHVTSVGKLGNRDVAAEAARHFGISVLKRGRARHLDPPGRAVSERLARDGEEAGAGGAVRRHHGLQLERVWELGVRRHGQVREVGV